MSLDTVSANTAPGSAEALLDDRAFSKLRWRCRRGLLENDLFVERYCRVTGATLTVRQAQALQVLMDLSDPDLLDLLLARREPEGELDLPEGRAVWKQMRAVRAQPLN